MKYLDDALISKAFNVARLNGTPGTRSYRTSFREALKEVISNEYEDVKEVKLTDRGVLVVFNAIPDKVLPMSFRQLKTAATKLFGKDTDEYKEFMANVR